GIRKPEREGNSGDYRTGKALGTSREQSYQGEFRRFVPGVFGNRIFKARFGGSYFTKPRGGGSRQTQKGFPQTSRPPSGSQFRQPSGSVVSAARKPLCSICERYH
ncbi:unnamed protein product, partial [Citrullus colocynthis]